MGTTISQRELRNDSGVIMRRVEQGESFVVTRNGTPVRTAPCAAVRGAGRDPKPRRFDPLISAVAVALRLPVLTRNADDFAGINDALTVVAIP